MAEVSEDFVTKLKAVRGEFQNSRMGRIGNRILAHVFSTLFPMVFIGFLVFWSGLAWPPTSENVLFIVIALAAFSMGLMFHRIINSRYVLDDEGIREYRGNGMLKQHIRWDDLEKVEYRESRGIKSFTLVSKGGSMHLEYYKGLSEALARIEKKVV